MDLLRRGLGEDELNYLGFSYGTFLGATYATLFPRNYDRFVLDGPLDAEGYINHPSQSLEEQTSGFERALSRFFQACAADQDACSEFGGSDPWLAFDELIDRANASPLPADDFPADPRPVDGDDIIFATTSELYARQFWGELAFALALADLRRHLRVGDEAWGEFDHFYFNVGYVGVNYALWPVRDRDAFRGPFRIPQRAGTPLVVAVTYDPATPFNGARRLVRDLGNARFLEVRGDGHTAYGSTGPCADDAINAYLLQGTLPAPGTVCDAEQPFTAFAPEAAARQMRAQAVAARRDALRGARLQRPRLAR